MNFCLMYHITLIFFIYSITTPLLSTEIKEGAKNCVKIKSHHKRLLCFDKIFNTPLYINKMVKLDTKKHMLLNSINDLENKRGKNLEWLYTKNKSSFLVTQQSLSNNGTLAIECKSNITGLNLVLPDNINTGSVYIIFKDSNNNKINESIWRVIDDKQLVIYPRGIPTVKLIQNLLKLNQININIYSSEENKEKNRLVQMSFSLNNLNTVISPLKTACHW